MTTLASIRRASPALAAMLQALLSKAALAYAEPATKDPASAR